LRPGQSRNDRLSAADVEKYKQIRGTLIGLGKACIGDELLIRDYIKAFNKGQHNLMHALDCFVDARERAGLLVLPTPQFGRWSVPEDFGPQCEVSDCPDCKRGDDD